MITDSKTTQLVIEVERLNVKLGRQMDYIKELHDSGCAVMEEDWQLLRELERALVRATVRMLRTGWV